MPRNTLLLIIFLGIFAAAVVGVNLARMGSNTQDYQQTTDITPTLSPSPTANPLLTFSSLECGISLKHPSNYTTVALENGNTTFLNPEAPIEATTIQCQNNLPRMIPKGSITSEFLIGTISATMYTPTASSAAQEKKKLYFRNPLKKKDVVVSGSGETFDTLITSLTIQ